MRRTAFQGLRSARRAYVRRGLGARTVFLPGQHGLGLRTSDTVFRQGQPLPILQSSLFFRNFAWIVATLVAGGAWFAYNKDEEKAVQANFTNSSNTSPILGSLHSPSAFSDPSTTQVSTQITTNGESVAESTRRALVVENDQFYAGDIVGDEPISKQTDASGRLVLEMLTPDQATQKLRQNEQSYLVGRGQGVLRYDVIQVASNSPIEDDHAEKIVQHNDSTASSEPLSSDWMFWGVFDGHR